MTDREYSLIELKDVANEACKVAIDNADKIGGAVNWADLKCIEAQRYFNDRGEIGYRVLIEEAHPIAEGLLVLLDSVLSNKGFAGIDIELNW